MNYLIYRHLQREPEVPLYTATQTCLRSNFRWGEGDLGGEVLAGGSLFPTPQNPHFNTRTKNLEPPDDEYRYNEMDTFIIWHSIGTQPIAHSKNLFSTVAALAICLGDCARAAD